MTMLEPLEPLMTYFLKRPIIIAQIIFFFPNLTKATYVCFEFL